MKRNYIMLAAVMMMGVSGFSQKDELKLAEKSLKRENLVEASSAIKQAEGVMANATPEEKAKFLYLKGRLELALANNGENKSDNLNASTESFLELIKLESGMSKQKYSELAGDYILELRRELINTAVEENEASEFDKASTKLYKSYLLDTNDTIKLYYAASSAVTGTHYDKALKYYNMLVELGFTGKTKSYTAVNKETNEVENFGPSSITRDLMVEQGTHVNPRVIKEESKRGEIVKNIALIYNIQGDSENAKRAIVEARKENPDDFSLLLTEANMYLESKEMDKYRELIQEAIERAPDNPDLYYNLGVVSAQQNDNVKAKEYYLKAIELNPEMENAYINLATVLLSKEQEIVAEMNGLGNSAKDNIRYDELKEKRKAVFESTVPYLSKALEINPGNSDAGLTLANIFMVLGKYDEAKELKAKFGK